MSDEYERLIIKQYWTQPNARAEIKLKSDGWEATAAWLRSFIDEFDVDLATGDRLDIIGRIVGINRLVPDVLPKIAFGFSENPNARGFDDRFFDGVESAPFLDRFERPYTPQQLGDADYRFFIKARIAVNNTSAFMVSDERISVSDVIARAFGGEAYVIDKYDMRLVLYINPLFDLTRLRLIQRLGLLPKPQGVRYAWFVQAAPGVTFGFADNPDALPFADKFTGGGGLLANKVF